ncbi:hypothetical protein V6N12_049374 [Hibiscus sabdariffa]|uniref:Uncharacterized protein n=1 Tax=Hibiscus sabdariffa TaxID=183260 RepID=A0ABR2CB47_9ROSI
MLVYSSNGGLGYNSGLHHGFAGLSMSSTQMAPVQVYSPIHSIPVFSSTPASFMARPLAATSGSLNTVPVSALTREGCSEMSSTGVSSSMETSTNAGNFPFLVVTDGSTKACWSNSDMGLSNGPSPAPVRVCDEVGSSRSGSLAQVPVQAVEVYGSSIQAQNSTMSQSQTMDQCVGPGSESVAHSSNDGVDSGSSQQTISEHSLPHSDLGLPAFSESASSTDSFRATAYRNEEVEPHVGSLVENFHPMQLGEEDPEETRGALGCAESAS